MNQLLENFDLVATAPDGIAQLRRLILELAVRGKLVPQEPNDEPASALLLNIEREKARLIKKGEIKQGNTLPAISTADIPYNLPDGWEWVRLNQIATILMGQSPESSTYNKNKEGLPFFQGKSDFGQFFPTTRTWCTDPQRIAPAGSVLISVRAPVGPTNISTEISCIGRGLSALVPLGGIAPMLLLFFIRAFESEIAKLGFGSTFVAITKTDVECFLFPLPPLSEQSRIVARVQELMAVLDRLNERTKDAEKAREQTLLATTRYLPQMPTPEALAHGWGEFSENLDRLVRRAEDVKTLRSMVLELAVRGKLVPQDPKEEPASALLDKIKANKARLMIDGPKKTREAVSEAKEEISDWLPAGWQLSSLGGLVQINPRNQISDSTEVSFIPMTLIPDSPFQGHGQDTRTWAEVKTGFTHFAENDVCIAKITPCYENGKGCVFHGLRNGYGAGTTELHIFRPIEGTILSQYLHVFLKSPAFVEAGINKMTGTAGQKRLPKSYLEDAAFPLPPLAEQARIVARVRELMAVLDSLEKSLCMREEVASRLGEAVVKVG